MHKEYMKIHGVSNMKLLFNPLKAKLNPICLLLALLGARHILHVSRIWFKQGLINQRHIHLTMQMRKYTAMITCTVSTDTGLGIDPVLDFQFSVIISQFSYRWDVIRTCLNDVF
jgi:hypothetical protein